MDARVEVRNIARCKKRLKNMTLANLMPAMREATVLVHGQAVEYANFDRGYQTGYLKSSIRFNVDNLGDSIIGKVFTPIIYAPFVEFGTGQRGMGSYPFSVEGLTLTYREDWAGMTAQPFMYPSLHNNKKAVERIINKGFDREIRRAIGGS